MRKLFLATLSLCFCLQLSPARAQEAAKQFTLEQVMSAPFPSDLVAAPTGGSVAWIQIAKGARNIWVASPPEYKGRQLTTYNDDDGIEIGELVWTPDAKSIIYTRGGDLDGFGEGPNPRSVAEDLKQALWMVTLDGKPPRQLAEGHSAAVSPKGDRAAYVNNRNIWWVKLDGSEKPTALVEAKGRSNSLIWSKDGAKLAFVSARGDHSFIGVFEPGTKSVRYLDASVDRDSDPVWSNDSKQVAFIRIPASREAAAFAPRRSGQPWSLRAADVQTGSGREIWRADEGNGSVFRDIVGQDQLVWTNDNRIVFPWEKDGWTHLYALPATSSSATAKPILLTPGDFEVEHVTASADKREIIYSSNQTDIDRRYIWRVPANGSKQPTAVTAAVIGGNGIEWAPQATSDGKVAFFHSDARRPPRAAIQIGVQPIRDLAPDSIPAEFPESQLVEPEQVILNGSDGMKIHGQLFLPPNFDRNVRRPAVIFFHGGSRRQMLLGWHYMYYYRNSYAMNQFLANHGYIVLSVNYRSGIGYGMEFREALNYGATGGSEFNDVMGAGIYMRNRRDVDPQRIGLWGGSYGGYLTAMGLSRASDLFAAGVDMHGVHDWNIVVRNFVPAYDPLAKPEAARLAFESSPLSSVKTWRSPVLLIHGDDDRNVPFSETVHLVEALRNQGVEFEQLIFPDEIHDFLTHEDWLRAYHASADFLDRHLKK
ncbi:MAG TPA: prolyl oligopeptidase family serine peptidase [Pyrinomonadaceae bacterium]|nr:prolyl oligopeptidase family serine peptidase [Pyrinomonadaceae bacterium]